MKQYKLGDVCNIVSGGTPSRSNSLYWNGGTIPWIKIGNISKKYVDSADEYITQEGLDGSSAKMLPAGTILYTIFATLGEVGILKINACTNQAIAGLTIKNPELVRTDYIYYYLKSKKSYVSNIGRGVAQNNINMSMLRDFDIPLPAIEKQDEIVSVLERTASVIEARKTELDKLDELVKARFVEMFGDPVHNTYGLPEATLPELGIFGRGVSKHRPRNDPKLLNGPYPLIQTGDVANSELYITSYSSTYSELGLQQSKMWDKGTLCITIAANIAQTAILTFDACFPDSVVGFMANDKTSNIFIHYWFSFFQEILESQAPMSAQKNINLKVLSELKVITPDRTLQDEFEQFVKQVDKSKSAVRKSLEETQMLFNSLMQKNFGG